MKRLFYISIVLTLSIIFVACGSKTANSTKAPDTTKSTTSNATNNNNTKIAYTKEFSYLPAYNSDMKADRINTTLSTANYTIKNAINTEVVQNYESILKKDGWTIAQEQKANGLMGFIAKKDTHQATLILMQNNKDVIISVKSK